MANTVLQLTKIRLLEMFNSLVSKMNKKKNVPDKPVVASKIVMIVLAVIFILLMLFSFFSVFASFALITSEFNCNELFFVIVGLASLCFSIMGSVLASQSYLFEAKDNELLLSMPIPPMAILISRVTSLYILNFIYSLIITLPATLAYGLIIGYSVTGFIFNLISIIIIPMFTTALCCILGWLLWVITTRLPFKNLITVLLSIGMMAVIMLVTSFAEPIMKSVIDNFEQCMELIRTYLAPLYWYSMAVYNSDILSLILLIALCIASITVVFLVISKFYTKIISTKTTTKRKKYVAKPMEQSSVLVALAKKELSTILCKPMYFINCGMGTILGIIFGIALLFNGNEFSATISQEPSLARITGFGLVVAMSMLCVLNETSAPSISLESKTLWILKTIPVDYMDIFMAKALMSPVISLPAIIFFAISSAIVLPVTVVDIIFMIVLPIMCAMLSGFLGVFINLKFPRFDYTSEIAVVKQSLSVFLTMIISLFVAFIPFVIAFFIALFSKGANILLPYAVCTIYFAVVLVGLYILLRTNGKKTFTQL